MWGTVRKFQHLPKYGHACWGGGGGLTLPVNVVSRVHKTKGMQRLISSLWGTGTAKFYVTWLLHIVQKGVSMSQCCAVDRWLMPGAYRCKTRIHLSHSSFLFSSRKLAERVHKGRKLGWFKDRHTQQTIGALIARKWTRLRPRFLRHQLLQVCASSCLMTCVFMRRERLSILKACLYIFYLICAFTEVTLLEIPPCLTPMCGVA